MPIDLYPNISKVKRNGAWQNLPGFVPQSGDADIKAMIANSEISTTAQYAHSAGSYFILNDVLYKAIIDIAVNDTIAVGTNCRVAILSNDVSEIESDVDDLKSDIAVLEPSATSADIGKALIAKTVSGGKVTEYEFGEAGGEGVASEIVKTIENVPMASFDDGANAPIKSLVVNVEPVQSGTGDPSPENERPITGWTGCEVNVTGKNLWNPNTAIEGYIGGSGSISQQSGTSKEYCTDFIPIPSDAVYAIGGYNNYGSEIVDRWSAIALYDENKVFIDRPYFNFDSADEGIGFKQLSSYPTAKYVRISSRTYNHGTEYLYFAFSATKDKSFTPFSGTTASLTFPDSAGTVYGATVDLVNKELVVDRVKITATAFAVYSVNYGTILLPGASTTTDVATDYITSIIPVNNTAQDYTSRRVSGTAYFYFPQGTTQEEAEAIINGIEIVYPLANPITYQLTSQEINTLKGYNNIWANTGNVKSLEYYVDTKNYIDKNDNLIKALIAPVLNSMVADTSLSANDFRIVGDTLYKITSSISSGGTLTPNTNCVATTICAEITAILNT